MSNPHTFSDFGDFTPEDMSQMAAQLVERLTLQNDSGLQLGDAVGFSEEFFDASYTLGVRYYANQQYDKAHELFKLLCTLQPLNARNFKAWGANYLGQAHYFLKDYDEARGHLRFAQEMARRNPTLWPQIEQWSAQLLERIESKSSSS